MLHDRPDTDPPLDGPLGTPPGDPTGRGDLPAGPVSATMHRAKAQARAAHVTVGQVRHGGDGGAEIDCSCGMVLTNGADWSLDEHIRLHRAEARYVALSRVAPPGMPRLLPVGQDRLPR